MIYKINTNRDVSYQSTVLYTTGIKLSYKTYSTGTLNLDGMMDVFNPITGNLFGTGVYDDTQNVDDAILGNGGKFFYTG